MSTTFHLRIWTRFLAPVEDVWRIKTDPARIDAEFRPYAGFAMAEDAALARLLASGTPGELKGTFKLGRALPIAWPVRVEAVVPNVSFRDTSTNRLFTRFEHDHLFEPTPDGCRYVDAVTFTSTVPLQKVAAITLQRVFQHRHRVAAALLPTDPEATGVAVLRVLVEDEDEQRKAG